jgi:cytochrome bd-type quinol oxidase subunit 1
MQGIAITFTVFTIVYVFLSVALVSLLRRQFAKTEGPASEILIHDL